MCIRDRSYFTQSARVLPVPELYHGSADTILNVVKRQTSETVALIAHNPGIAQFATRIVAAPARHPRFQDYPTAATAIIEFQTAWSSVESSGGRLAGFTVPRDLMAGEAESTLRPKARR